MLYDVYMFSGSSEYISYSSVYEVKIGPLRSINSFHLILKLVISIVNFWGCLIIYLSSHLSMISHFFPLIISTRHTWV